MPSQFQTIVQSAVLKSAANLTAQLASSWRSPNTDPRAVDWQSVAEFAIFGLIQAHINCYWQRYLEDTFPSRLKGSPKTLWHNVLFKLVLDQTVGLFIMNTVFLVSTHAIRLSDLRLVIMEVNRKIWPLIRKAWKIWPACALINFLWVPVESRVLVASCVGFGWNIFLTLYALAK
ncbi:hypothetical protein BJY04DRAFT_200916 [Aspergillus karnatakaensis]|uniref:Mpv17/PMP22 family protein n=1 Tax=Aspergillus karnatakaensis TaxID=1810916 RepID=UPI003CCC9C57